MNGYLLGFMPTTSPKHSRTPRPWLSLLGDVLHFVEARHETSSRGFPGPAMVCGAVPPRKDTPRPALHARAAERAILGRAVAGTQRWISGLLRTIEDGLRDPAMKASGLGDWLTLWKRTFRRAPKPIAEAGQGTPGKRTSEVPCGRSGSRQAWDRVAGKR